MSRVAELLFDYKFRGSLRYVYVMYSITEFKRKVFLLSESIVAI